MARRFQYNIHYRRIVDCYNTVWVDENDDIEQFDTSVLTPQEGMSRLYSSGAPIEVRMMDYVDDKEMDH